MKIIKHPDENWTHSFTCRKCQAELEAEKDDLIFHPATQDGPYYGAEFFSLKCPVCQEDQSPDQKLIPEIVKIRVREKHQAASILSVFGK